MNLGRAFSCLDSDLRLQAGALAANSVCDERSLHDALTVSGQSGASASEKVAGTAATALAVG